jgi:hypothetical protein
MTAISTTYASRDMRRLSIIALSVARRQAPSSDRHKSERCRKSIDRWMKSSPGTNRLKCRRGAQHGGVISPASDNLQADRQSI